MSALLVDELDVLAPSRPQPTRWRHVERGPQARPQLTLLPGGRPAGVAAPRLGTAAGATGQRSHQATAPAPLRLTDRGIAVVVGFFLALLVTAVVVLVSGFLAVSDAPLSVPAAPGAVSGQS